MPQASRELVLANQMGLHARPASQIVAAATRFRAAVTLANGKGRAVNAKSIMEVLTLAAATGATLVVRAEGEDAEQAVSEIARLIETGFGEA